MTVTSFEDQLINQLRDLYNAETQVQSAYEQWGGQAVSEELSQFLRERHQHAGDHIELLENLCESLGVDPTGEKCHGMEGLITEGDTFMEESGESPARDAGILANVRRVEHYFLAGYDHARICAEQLDEEDVVEQLQHLLDDAEETDGRAVEHTELLADPQAQEAGSAA
ncbi:ferritin-like domain-containing protein [Salinibacter grassmerensis]|uniref:YciE/YciF ferroxidase family protein n=1 Tax=Salinibacter grassmerensis TaxID=3040353 RepID=UPI0021E9536B|nr:DUF892 family protein [Salinibacter grassmerensis]